jgi:hypothetical protein
MAIMARGSGYVYLDSDAIYHRIVILSIAQRHRQMWGAMRISELSRHTGVTVPTIKFYLRTGLLSPGAASGRNQAEYGEPHVHRLALIRVLQDVGGLDLARVARIVRAIEGPGLPRHELFGIAQRALAPEPPTGDAPDDVRIARADVDAFLADLGWMVEPAAPARASLADALVALRRLGRPVAAEVFAPYAEAADRLAWWEVETIPSSTPPGEAIERMVIGTVVFEAALDALRRLAHEHHSAGAT